MDQTTKLRIYCDGGARGNPGPAAAAFLVTGLAETESYGFYLGETTNNVAEYAAVLAAWQWLKRKYQKKELENLSCDFYLDSELVVKQLNREYKIKDPKLRLLYQKIGQIARGLPVAAGYKFINREQNQLADRLVNEVFYLSSNLGKDTRRVSVF